MWLADTIRLTIFQTLPINIDEIDWWEGIVGAAPHHDNIARQVGERKQEGPFSNGILKLEITPGRVDWVLSPVTDIQGELPARLGNVKEKTTEFINLFNDWLPIQKNVNRLAFGLIAITPQEDHESAYAHLNSCLPHVNLQQGSYDFLYQINKPQTFDIDNTGELKINRLSRWYALKGGRIIDVNGTKQQRDYYASRFELDINTDATRIQEFPSNALLPITNKLVELGLWIADNGEVE